MDEILIEDKKYISSKRAAKETGYAKDYVGQLCREGRVPARLVGRSWYVLESAIKDHRFGEFTQPSMSGSLSSTWEAPRYEASGSKAEFLPQVNRLSQENDSILIGDKKKESTLPQQLQDSWHAWFERVGENIETGLPAVVPKIEKESEVSQTPDMREEDTEIQIPIHTIYQAPPEELLPRITADDIYRKQETLIQKQVERKVKKPIGISMQLVGALISLFLGISAVSSSGYFDKYIFSANRANILAGVSFYNR